VRLKDKAYLPVIIKGCLQNGEKDQPFKWWERFVSVCDVVDYKNSQNVIMEEEDKGKVSAYLCASILSEHSAQYYKSLFFSTEHTSSEEGENWITEVVRQASVSDREIGNMKEAHDILISYNNNKMALNSSVENLLKSNEEAKRLYYTRAVAYQMLLGGGVGSLKQMKCY
jgi:hypothetical protein